MYMQFASNQSISKETAKEQSLPSSLIEMRQKKKLFYPSKEYFSFILLVESTYIKNLTLKMMMAFMEGDLVKEINDAILRSDWMRSKFRELVGDDNPAGESDYLNIMKYLLERYLHMRGCWFVKFMKGNQQKSMGERRAENDATRTKVAYADKQSKAVAEAVRSKLETQGNTVSELWDGVAKSVVELENDEADDNSEESNEEE